MPLDRLCPIMVPVGLKARGGKLPDDGTSDRHLRRVLDQTLSGLDLIVGVSPPIERSCGSLESQHFSAVFRFCNVLSSDRYMIFVALQRGSPHDV